MLDTQARQAVRLVRPLIALLAATAVAPCIAQTAPSDPLQAAVREVIEVERAFALTMADRDLKAFSGFVAEDAVFRSGEKFQVGRAAVYGETRWRAIVDQGVPLIGCSPANH
ncbi:MAG: hypothetical protein JO133_03790 [Burkholderiaceae bacterium]|nr:hypothetical protein [Burkholderiaceae bacterium]